LARKSPDIHHVNELYSIILLVFPATSLFFQTDTASVITAPLAGEAVPASVLTDLL
jgi:hypothetical protein